MEYADEPRLIFSSVSEEDYSDFYDLEMKTFGDDVPFYTSRLKEGDYVLELGCGTGRISRHLSRICKHITAIDISAEMIRRAKLIPTESISYLQMDMVNLRLSNMFNIIIIPYNTLNLLGDREKIEQCLQRCKEHLAHSGKLLLQLYHPDERLVAAEGERLFQFAIHQRENGDKVIKETLKSYDRGKQTLLLEERYRVRPLVSGAPNRDLRHFLTLYAPRLKTWREIFANCGFNHLQCYGDYNDTPFSAIAGTTLLLYASPQYIS